jgi:hypothetical protein
MPNGHRINLTSLWVEPIKRGTVSTKCARSTKPNINGQRFPAIDNCRGMRNALDTAWRKEELTEKGIEGPNKPRMPKSRIQFKRMTLRDELFDGGVCERQDSHAPAGGQVRRNARNPRHDSRRFSGTWTGFHKCAARMTCKRPLLFGEVHYCSAALRMACSRYGGTWKTSPDSIKAARA